MLRVETRPVAFSSKYMSQLLRNSPEQAAFAGSRSGVEKGGHGSPEIVRVGHRCGGFVHQRRVPKALPLMYVVERRTFQEADS